MRDDEADGREAVDGPPGVGVGVRPDAPDDVEVGAEGGVRAVTVCVCGAAAIGCTGVDMVISS